MNVTHPLFIHTRVIAAHPPPLPLTSPAAGCRALPVGEELTMISQRGPRGGGRKLGWVYFIDHIFEMEAARICSNQSSAFWSHRKGLPRCSCRFVPICSQFEWLAYNLMQRRSLCGSTENGIQPRDYSHLHVVKKNHTISVLQLHCTLTIHKAIFMEALGLESIADLNEGG